MYAMHMRSEETVRSLTMGVARSSESTDIGAENSNQVLWKSRESY